MKTKDIIYLTIILLLIIVILMLFLDENNEASPEKYDVSALYAEGMKLYDANDQKQALEVFTKCIEIDDKFADAYEYRGHCYYYDAPSNPPKYEKFLFAYENFKKALELDSSKEHLRNLMAESIVHYVELGLCFSTRPIGEENFREGFEWLSKAIDVDPNYSWAYRQRAWIIETTALHLAISDMRKAIELGETDSFDYTLLSNLYSMGGYTGFYAFLENQVERDETNYYLWELLAEEYSKINYLEDMEKAIENALKYCPEDRKENLKVRIKELRDNMKDN